MQKDGFTYMKDTKRTKTTGSRALPKVGFQRTEVFVNQTLEKIGTWTKKTCDFTTITGLKKC